MSVLHDEQGKVSLARASVVGWLAFCAAVILLDVFGRQPSEPVYPVLVGIGTMLIVWAAGPRMAQYLAPLAGKVVEKVTEIARRRDAKEKFEDTP